jgi:hypothetical protein
MHLLYIFIHGQLPGMLFTNKPIKMTFLTIIAQSRMYTEAVLPTNLLIGQKTLLVFFQSTKFMDTTFRSNLPILKAIPHLNAKQITPLIAFSSKELLESVLLLVWNVGERAITIDTISENIFIKHKKTLKALKIRKTPKRVKRAILADNPNLTKTVVSASLPFIEQFFSSPDPQYTAEREESVASETAATPASFENPSPEEPEPDWLEKLLSELTPEDLDKLDYSNLDHNPNQ